MTPHQPNPGNRTTRTHGRLVPNIPRRGVPPGNGEDFIYDPHGVCEGENDVVDWDDCSLLFEGMRHDPEQAWPYGCGRAFDPTVSRWLDAGPCGYMDGLDAYAAPVDDPVNPINPQDVDFGKI